MRFTKRSSINFLPGISLGLMGGWLGAQLSWVYFQLARADVKRSLSEHHNQAKSGEQLLNREESQTYQMRHSIEDGIERIVYTPTQRRFETPILMQHGMYHGAWCWRWWQELLAVWGWESVAVSLPGHGFSPTQRRIPLCTLDYYLGFLKAEIERLPHKPVLMGHSMGGALTQWYLKHVGDDLPAAILVAPWPSHSILAAGFWRLLNLFPLNCAMVSPAWESTPLVRDAKSAAKLFISKQALISPEELHAQLGRESALVLFQHNPPFWRPPQDLNTPMLWLAGELDAGIGEVSQRRSALFYKSDYYLAKGAGHNLMLEHNYRQSAGFIHDWLTKQAIV